MVVVTVVAFMILKIFLNLVFLQKSLCADVIKYLKSIQNNTTFTLNGLLESGVFSTKNILLFEKNKKVSLTNQSFLRE